MRFAEQLKGHFAEANNGTIPSCDATDIVLFCPGTVSSSI